MDIEKLKSIDGDLGMAAQCLRNAWKTMKHNGMEATAKEIADTVLDVETAAQMVSETLAANVELTGAASAASSDRRERG